MRESQSRRKSGRRHVEQRSELTHKPFRTLLLYVGMLAITVATFLWLSALGSSLVASHVTQPGLLTRGASREHAGDLFHVLLALLVVLIASRLVGTLFRYVNQPPVI